MLLQISLQCRDIYRDIFIEIFIYIFIFIEILYVEKCSGIGVMKMF